MPLPAPDVHVAITALRTKMTKLSPGAKYLYIRGMVLFENGATDKRQRDLAATVGMPVQALATAQRELIEAGYAAWNPTGSQSATKLGVTTQGQFRHGFALDAGRVRQVRLEATNLKIYIPSRPKEMLKKLLLEESTPALQLPEGMELRYANRLVAAVLMALSDDFGVVWNCSRGRLAELTGLTTGQVTSQVKKLETAGLVRHRIPGINGRDLFSSSPGAILLDLSKKAPLQPRPEHPPVVYRRLPESELQALMAFRKLFGRQRLGPETGRDYLPPEVNSVVDELVRAEYGVGNKSWPEELEGDVAKAIFRVSRWLGSTRQQGFYPHSVYKLSEYASLFLKESGKPGMQDAWRVASLDVENEPDISGGHEKGRIEQCVLRGIFRCYGYSLAREFTGYIRGEFLSDFRYLSSFREWRIVPGPYGNSELYFLRLPSAGQKISQV